MPSLHQLAEVPPDDEPVGLQIRDLRKAKRMTLTELAERIGRSVGYVSQVERGLSEVPLSTLKDIAEALEVQMSWFFQGTGEAPKEEAGYVVRAGNRRQLKFSGSGVVEEMLSPNLRGEGLVLLGTFEPGASTGAPNVRDVEESGLVLEGTFGLDFADRKFLLSAGDSFVIPRGASHTCHNPGDGPCAVVWFITPAIY